MDGDDVTGLHGELIRLRARVESDAAILDAELHDDVADNAMAGRTPWRPRVPGGEHSSYRPAEPSQVQAQFAVVELATDTLAGAAGLWGIDSHNRSAHLGLGLRHAYRGKGLGTDIVRVLCHYGFSVLGLHRLQVDTLADNHGMLAAAERVGFRRETLVRQCVWVLGDFADEVALGLLVHDWKARHDPAR
jgi:RimJ/RimL family protein N-acetyltransferase